MVRQYFWSVSNNLAAWALTLSLALSLSYFVFRQKEEPLQREGLSSSFYLIVALPLFVLYAIRAVFPDFSSDVLSYHIFAAETSLKGWPYQASVFMPRLNPLPDMVMGIYRHLLGYRLGTNSGGGREGNVLAHLEIDMVQEQVAWFGWAGSKTLRANVKVE